MLKNILNPFCIGLLLSILSCSSANISKENLPLNSETVDQSSEERIIAFPGAVGFGRFAQGGRFGQVYRVTNLNDSGAGSFRDAVSQPNRIVVFDVSGIIVLKSEVRCSYNLTVAGQTAPGDGIMIYGHGVNTSDSKNSIFRYLRIRMGDQNGAGQRDAMGQANSKNTIYDHLSVMWGRDENFSINWYKVNPDEPGNITIQNSIIGQGLQTHSCGGLIFSEVGITLYRNLYIDNKTRNPKAGGVNQYVNNVVYNWSSGGGYIFGAQADSVSGWGDIRNNYLIWGPAGATPPFTRGTPTFHVYASGNYFDDNRNGVLDGKLCSREDYGTITWIENPEYWDKLKASDPAKIPFKHPELPHVVSAVEALKWVIDSVGAVYPKRDVFDQYVIDELKSYGKRGTLITSETEIPHKVLGSIASGASKPVDSDNDGIPDQWEKANKLNANNPDDAMKIAANGYANLENYINSIIKLK